MRQLEAMVRLSEAIARLECSDEVPPSCSLLQHIDRLDRSRLSTWEKLKDCFANPLSLLRKAN